MNIQNDGLINGRRVSFFHHVSGEESGYAREQSDTFALLFPKDYDPGESYPLEVVFHSAGHDVYSAVACLWAEGNHDIYHTPEDMFGLFLDCRANENDWWWGGVGAMYEDAERETLEPQPVERRCISTVEWVRDNFPVDRERIYAVGNSMGGSGALGIALCRGDIFAAIKVNVAAGVKHAAARCCLDREAPEGFSIPEPPVVVDYSSQTDIWSTGHETLYRAAREKKIALHGYWGEFGHENDDRKLAEHNDLIHALPVLRLRLTDAYPVFTNATTDDKNPWEHGDSADKAGQVNGFFRWENVSDTKDRLEIRLWLLSEDEWETRVTLPEKATADLLIRRAQSFTLGAGERFSWSFGDVGGTSEADGEGHPEIKNFTVTRAPAVLVLERI